MEKPVLLRRRGPLNFERELDENDVRQAREYAQGLCKEELEDKLFEVCAAHRKAKFYTVLACAAPLLLLFGIMPYIGSYITVYPYAFMIGTPLVLCTPFLGVRMGLGSRRKIVTVLLAIRYQKEGEYSYRGA